MTAYVNPRVVVDCPVCNGVSYTCPECSGARQVVVPPAEWAAALGVVTSPVSGEGDERLIEKAARAIWFDVTPDTGLPGDDTWTDTERGRFMGVARRVLAIAAPVSVSTGGEGQAA